MNKKLLFLIVAFALPSGVFMFLKFFGKNEFQVEPLFQVKPDYTTECAVDYVFPYVVPDSVLQLVNWKSTDSLTLIAFHTNDAEELKEIQTQLTRVTTEIKSSEFSMAMLVDASDSLQQHANNNWSIVTVLDKAMLKQCYFFGKTLDNLVVIDNQKRIRGLYNLSYLDDADRLIAEMKIMLRLY